MAYTTEQQTQIIAEGKRRAAANGTTLAQEIAKVAQQNGMGIAGAQVQLGMSHEDLYGTGASASPAPTTATMGANVSNLGMGKLDDATRNGVIAEAQKRAAANGTTPEAELYKFNQGQGQSNAQLDSLMGFSAGSADSWAKQNAGQYGVAAPSGNSYSGGSTPAPSGNSYSGWPTPATPPTGGTYNPGTNTTTGSDIMGPGRRDMGYGGGGKGNLGFGDTGYQRNPYLDQASRDIGAQMFDQWSRNIQPSIRSNAMAAGGFGGSRQGVVEANALNDMSRNYGQALTTMYGQDYTNSQNRGIQRQGQAQNYDLGLRNNDLGFGQLDANIYQNNFGNNLAAANFGLGVQNQLNSNNAAGVNAGTNIQNTPLDYQKYLNSAGVQAGGAGGTRTGTTTS